MPQQQNGCVDFATITTRQSMQRKLFLACVLWCKSSIRQFRCPCKLMSFSCTTHNITRSKRIIIEIVSSFDLRSRAQLVCSPNKPYNIHIIFFCLKHNASSQTFYAELANPTINFSLILFLFASMPFSFKSSSSFLCMVAWFNHGKERSGL